MNQVQLSASVLDVKTLRYTPAGMPVLELLLNHQSEQSEEGHPKLVELTIQAKALGNTANTLSVVAVGAKLNIKGFLAPARKNSTKLLLHIQQVSIVSNPVVSYVV